MEFTYGYTYDIDNNNYDNIKIKTMNDYFKNVDLIIKNKIDNMPSQRNTADKSAIFIGYVHDALSDAQEQLRTLFNEYTKDKNLSKQEIDQMNEYNRKSIQSIISYSNT